MYLNSLSLLVFFMHYRCHRRCYRHRCRRRRRSYHLCCSLSTVFFRFCFLLPVRSLRETPARIERETSVQSTGMNVEAMEVPAYTRVSAFASFQEKPMRLEALLLSPFRLTGVSV